MARSWSKRGWCSSDRILGARALQHRRPVEPKVPEQIDERLQPLAAIGFDIKPLVIEKARAVAQTSAPLGHVALDDVRRSIPLIPERAGEVAAGVVENIAAAPVDEFEQAEHREAKAESIFYRLVDILRAGDALFDHARGLVHGERLDARHDVARPRRANDRHLADAFEQRFYARG